MAKGKKTTIKEIKLINDDELLINGKEYIIVEGTSDIETAITMKISSNGNRILRFKDEAKKARIDVKRSIEIIRCTIADAGRAKKFAKTFDKKYIIPSDTRESIGSAASFVKARDMVAKFKDKKNEAYDKSVGVVTFFLFEE